MLDTPPRRHRAGRALLRGRGAAVVVGMLALALAAPVGSSAEPAAAADWSPVPAPPTPATHSRVASFNVLGADHTAPGGNRRGWDTGVVRIERVVNLLNEEDLDVVGFQEFQPPQAQRFQELTGTSWQTYPGLIPEVGAPSVNSIAWRTDTWTLVQAQLLPVPYFDGVPSRMPYVLLQNVQTGRQVWFFNTHNPADTRGPAQRWRDEGFAMEAKLANDLRAAYPGTPFISFGDKNETSDYYCAVAPAADMWSASGGYVDGSTCSPPTGGAIDWIMGTKDVFFNAYTRRQDAYVKATTDHPLYMANAVIPAAAPATIEHVVVVAVPGLTTSAVRSIGEQAKALSRMETDGASTTNARTTKERVGADANLFSVLTGRRVNPGAGGHGVDFRGKNPATVHKAAGQYVSSIFDLAHNNSLSTALVGSRSELALARKSWNSKFGGSDPYGAPDGSSKIDRFKVLKHDYKAATWWRAMTTRKARDLSVIELSGALQQGERERYRGEDYKKAIIKVDRVLRKIQRTVRYDPQLRDRTMLVVVGTQGAMRSSRPHAWRQGYRVPLYVTGPGVPAGSDLYDLNALNVDYASPGGHQPGYSGAQPIRTGDVANLVTRALRLPAVPGSVTNPYQGLQVFDPAALPDAGDGS
ncbi:hypothetical protein EXE58_13345 [Nocardioides seonyuensis]|uniref:Endonuclease/exonuclease/phosphatase domain-containing protein n=1 Tax=Nocardioides seonyuensis TaxID=2518371 RepID=A0A4P7II03_9ACTN|nr:endonuclease/exonuclease/phosphatase family protein [Nocardioides seonyuensis]QBX56353.1 hypothetical protein EXE58_13345 [Nocardioides seonyuensis]